MLTIEHYFEHYERFNAEFYPDASSSQILKALYQEAKEFTAAYESADISKAIDDELPDLINMSLKCGQFFHVDPLAAGLKKLEATADKLRRRN